LDRKAGNNELRLPAALRNGRAEISQSSQRRFLLLVSLLLLGGCEQRSQHPELVWGKAGVRDGYLVKPRAVAIDGQDRLYLVDWTARIQVYDCNGKHLGRTWTTPDFRKGRPSGLSIDRKGNLLVSDSHYGLVRTYDADGKLLQTFGEYGALPGKFSYISDVIQDAEGYYYVAEFGENQRISKLDGNGRFLKCWGAPGADPGQFARLRALALGSDGNLYAADACNHRIQVFTREGQFLYTFGKAGAALGELSYPYDLAFAHDGRSLYVVEYGNQRVQKFDVKGESLGCWGGPGREPGKLYNPWALAVDSLGRVHVIDSENNRVQRLRF